MIMDNRKLMMAESPLKKYRIGKKFLLMSLVCILSFTGFSSCGGKQKELTREEQLAELKSQVNNFINRQEYDSAFMTLDNINNFMTINHIDRNEFSNLAGDLYLKLVVSLIQKDDLEGAALVGLDYREKLDSQYKWEHSGVYKVLIQECEVQNFDDSPLR